MSEKPKKNLQTLCWNLADQIQAYRQAVAKTRQYLAAHDGEEWFWVKTIGDILGELPE